MYQHILVPVDGSPTSTKGLDEAIRLAKLSGGRLRLIHIIDDLSLALAMDAYSGVAGNWRNELHTHALTVLDMARDRAAAQGVSAEVVLRDIYKNTVHEQVLAEAADCHADLIVIGTHGRRGLGRWVLGSSAEQILRMAQVPVLLVRAPE
ncbi:universal stress protein [Delftia tsuruhatensis]|uniref:universal stress protein n=1 Tax=Delftia tsuruhatensis TaxID=180282 RepID=UPI003D2610E7